MKLGIYIMAAKPISTEYFINPPRQYVYMCINVTAATNTHVTTEELLGTSSHVRMKGN
jgi:hypothetical protein